MRVAYVGPYIPDVDEVDPGPVDVRWLRDLRAEGHEVVCLVDHDGPGAQVLREEGISVHAAPKRALARPDGTVASSDAMQAAVLLHAHRADPLALVLVSGDAGVDLAWHEPELAQVPRWVVLGADAAADLRLVLDDAHLVRTHGRALWLRSSWWAAAECIVAAAPPDTWGVRGEHLPPVVLRGPPLGAPPDGPVGLAVVVATTLDARRAVRLLPRVVALPFVAPTTTVVVLFPDVGREPYAVRDLILEGCPEDVAQQVVLVPTTEEGAATSFAAAADVLVAEHAVDLGTSVAANAPAVVLLESQPSGGSSQGWDVRPVPQRGAVLTVEVSGRLGAAVAALDALASGDDGPEVVVLHAPEFTDEATRIAAYPRLACGDVAVMCRSDAVFGAPIPDEPCRYVVAAHRRIWPSLRRLAVDAASLDALVVALLDLGNIEHIRVLHLPGDAHGCVPLEVGSATARPPWTESYGALPRPNLVGAGGAGPARGALRPPVLRRLRRSRLAAVVRRRNPALMRRLREAVEGVR